MLIEFGGERQTWWKIHFKTDDCWHCSLERSWCYFSKIPWNFTHTQNPAFCYKTEVFSNINTFCYTLKSFLKTTCLHWWEFLFHFFLRVGSLTFWLQQLFNLKLHEIWIQNSIEIYNDTESGFNHLWRKTPMN